MPPRRAPASPSPRLLRSSSWSPWSRELVRRPRSTTGAVVALHRHAEHFSSSESPSQSHLELEWRISPKSIAQGLIYLRSWRAPGAQDVDGLGTAANLLFVAARP